MSRRNRSGGYPTAVLAEKVQALGLYSWAEADNYTVDGVSGKPGAFNEMVSDGTGIKLVAGNTHSYAQATSAQQVALPAVQSTWFAGRAVATFAGTQRYVSSAPASAWSRLTSGAGVTIVNVFRRPSAAPGNCLFLCTQAGGARGSGFDLNLQPGPFYAAVGADAVTVAGNATGDADQYIAYTQATVAATTTTRLLVKQGQVFTSTGVAAVAGPPTSPLVIGTDPTGAFGNTIYWAGLFVFGRVLTAQEYAVLGTYIASRWGIPAA